MLPSRYANGVYSYPCIRDRKKVDKERGEGAAKEQRATREKKERGRAMFVERSVR